MTVALSTVVNTPFANHITTREAWAIADAQTLADTNGAPCGVWMRDGWYTVCEVAPEMIEPQPELTGWSLWAVVEPMAWAEAEGGL